MHREGISKHQLPGGGQIQEGGGGQFFHRPENFMGLIKLYFKSIFQWLVLQFNSNLPICCPKLKKKLNLAFKINKYKMFDEKYCAPTVK